MANWLMYLAAMAVKSTLVLGVAWVVTLTMRKRSAAARHVVWTAAFVAVLALPLLTAALPQLSAPGLSGVLPSASDPVFSTNASASLESVGATTASAVRPVRAPRTSWAVPDWRVGVLLIWACGALLFAVRTLVACARMARARKAATGFAAVLDGMAPPSGVHVLKSPSGSMPLAFGIVKPVVFMPADALLWDAERRRMVLQHEFAHIQRGDLATHFVARAGLSLLWWNPLAWKAWGEFLKERERAADDLVLRAGARASAYAAHLLEIARTVGQDSEYGLAAVAMARPAQLEGRLVAILDGAINHGAPRRVALVASAVAALVCVLPVAALQSQDSAQVLPADMEATIRTAMSQKNHQILDNAATALMKAKQYDTARKLEDAALQVRESETGSRSGSYAEGLVKLADLEMARKNHAEAVKFYEQAVALGDRPEVLGALRALGTDALLQKNQVVATGYLQRALNVATAPEAQSHILLLLASADVLDRSGTAQADAHYQAAITAAPADSSTRIATRMVYARFLEAQGQVDEAKTVKDAADEDLKALNARVRTTSARPSTATAYKVGNGVSQPVPVYHPEPEYSEDARAAKYQGSVLLYILVGADGHVSDVSVIKPLGLGLDAKAIEAVSQWTFKPGTKDGQPVPVQAQVEVNFKLL